MPAVVRPLDDLPDPARMNEQQRAAVEATGEVFVSAGAGTGKTTVLVERFVRAIEAGVDVGSILVITYTDRAAAELRTRIRKRPAELSRHDASHFTRRDRLDVVLEPRQRVQIRGRKQVASCGQQLSQLDVGRSQCFEIGREALRILVSTRRPDVVIGRSGFQFRQKAGYLRVG